MKNYSLIYLELKNFVDKINNIKVWNIQYDIIPELENKSNLRCMGRIWDYTVNCDINKQCKNKVLANDLCQKCYNRKNLAGRVDEYPNEDILINPYSKNVNKNPNNKRMIKNEINLNKFEKFIDINLKKKKIKKKKVFIIKKKMLQIEKESHLKSNEIFTEIVKQSDLNSNYKKYNIDNSLLDWWNDKYNEKIRIYDSKNNSSCVFAIERTPEKNYLLNKNKVIVGEFNEWLSDIFSDEIDNIYDPNTNLPLNEYSLYKDKKIYHDLSAGKYLPYRYDNHTEELINTNAIEFL